MPAWRAVPVQARFLLCLIPGLLVAAGQPLLEAGEAPSAGPSAPAPEVYEAMAPAVLTGPAYSHGTWYRLTGGDSADPLLRSGRYVLQARASYLPANIPDRGQ